MEKENKWHNLIENANNLYIDYELFEKHVLDYKPFYICLFDLKEALISAIHNENELSRTEILETIFATIYDFTTKSCLEFTYFTHHSPLHDSVYEACFFIVLCMFLHTTKRIDGKSLNLFTYDNSLYGFNTKSSIDFCPPKNYSDFLNSKTASFRKTRNRILSSRSVYNKRPQWSAMSKDSEYEWSLYHILTDDAPAIKETWIAEHNLTLKDYEIIRDTFKRIGNLYNGITEALNAVKNDDYNSNLEIAYAKFLSKLTKLKYENYLNLQKLILTYISANDENYGINIYRFEKEFKLYILTNELKQLLECTTESEEDEIITKSILLKDIPFPKVYNILANLPVYSDIELHVKHFFQLQNIIIPSCCLIIDEFIENDYFGEDWEAFFQKTINEMTERVLYDPKKFDFSIPSGAQEAFKRLLSEPVRDLLFQATGITFS